MKIPKTLKHKPVIAAEEYEKVDGRYAPNSDAKGLSLGLAQWNDRGRVEASAKVWRYTGEKWSRQSEELPLHRILDLAILICKAKNYVEQTPENKLFDPENTLIDTVTLQKASMEIELCEDNPMIGEDIALFAKALADDKSIIDERLDILYELLKPESRTKHISPAPKKKSAESITEAEPAPKKVKRAKPKVLKKIKAPNNTEEITNDVPQKREEEKSTIESYLL